MKAVLGCLLCLVLTISHTYALKGGPPYPGGGTNIVGRYAGVLRPGFCPRPNPQECNGGLGLNTLGVFSVPVPQTGISAGTTVIFARGQTYIGTITALGDPNSASLSGVLEASYQTTDIIGTSGSVTVRGITTLGTIGGRVEANIVAPRSGSLGTSSILIQGTATVTVTNLQVTPATVSPEIALQVAGFKQSNSAQ